LFSCYTHGGIPPTIQRPDSQSKQTKTAEVHINDIYKIPDMIQQVVWIQDYVPRQAKGQRDRYALLFPSLLFLFGFPVAIFEAEYGDAIGTVPSLWQRRIELDTPEVELRA
jgi:hypothetical protein